MRFDLPDVSALATDAAVPPERGENSAVWFLNCCV